MEAPSNLAVADFSTKIVTLESIPEIKNYLNLGGSDNFLNRHEESSFPLFNKNTIIETIDRDENVNYSISYIYEDTPENIFYNLVVNVLPTGEKSAYVFKYICNPADFKYFRENHYNFDYFNGVTEMSYYEGDLRATPIFNRDAGDDEPCPKVYIPSPNYGNDGPVHSGTSGGGSGGNGGGNYGSTTVINYNYYTGGSGGITSVSWGDTTYYAGGGTSSGSGSGVSPTVPTDAIYYLHFRPWEKQHQSRPSAQSRSGDCEEVVPPTGNVPVNQAAAQLQHLKTELVLDKAEMMWLLNHPEEMSSLYSCLGYNPDDTEIVFANEALDALVEGGEVDFEDK